MRFTRFRRLAPCGPSPGARYRSWRDAEYCVVDLETTGLDLRRDTIVAYGAVVVTRGRIVASTATYGLVAPESDLRPDAIAVHELRHADLASAPSLDDALDVLVPMLQGRVLVAHAAWVEQAFLNRALRRRRMRLVGSAVDTADLARAARLDGAHPGHEPALEALAGRLGLEHHGPHHALGDALTTAEVFLVLADLLARTGTRPIPSPRTP